MYTYSDAEDLFLILINPLKDREPLIGDNVMVIWLDFDKETDRYSTYRIHKLRGAFLDKTSSSKVLKHLFNVHFVSGICCRRNNKHTASWVHCQSHFTSLMPIIQLGNKWTSQLPILPFSKI